MAPNYSEWLTTLAIALTVMWIIHYLLKHQKFYRLAFKLPWAHPYLHPMITGYILAPFYKFDIYTILRNLKNNDKDLICLWLPDRLVIVKNTQHLSTVFSLTEKSIHYEGISFLIGAANLISSEGDVFRRTKKIFLRGFNGSSQEILLGHLFRETDKLLKRLEGKVGQELKLGPYLKFTNANIIFGGGMDSTVPEHHHVFHIVEEFDELVKTAMLKTVFTRFCPTFISSRILPFDHKLKKARCLIKEICDEVYLDKSKKFSDFLEKGEEAPNQFIYNVLRDRTEDPIVDIYADIITLAAAGLDTSAMTSGAALMLLGMHPDIQQKVLEEDLVVQKELGGRKMEESDFSRYELLTRVIKETTRRYPAIPSIARHVGKELTVGSYTIPEGCTLAVYLPYIHRDPANFPNPTKFDPDRFLPENVEKIHRHAFMAFSHGVRQCPGLRYGINSAVYLVSSIIRNFKVHSLYKTVEDMDQHITGFITLQETGEFPAKLERREGRNKT